MRVVLIFIAVLLFASILLQSGCATIQGVGRDIQSVGNSLENAAERVSN